MEEFQVIREVRELKSQLSYSKNMGFFFGAGTSCALGVPNIEQLTVEVEKVLSKKELTNFNNVKSNLIAMYPGESITIENILNHIRQIREITGERSDKEYIDVSGEAAKNLDIEICKNIFKLIMEKENAVDIGNTKKFFAWLNMQNRAYSKEIFTTNYDLIIEKALETTRIPYFDGFVGTYEPFFWQESIDKFVGQDDLTHNWIRLWKIHGSLNWSWKDDIATKSHRIIRIGKIDSVDRIANELVIYPSKEKYVSSRKQPFLAYFDRLKRYLSKGELLFIFTGYSFFDQHINEIIFNCLRQNNRLFVLVFFFKDDEVERLYSVASSYMNLNAFGPKKAIINGKLGEWKLNKDDLKPNENTELYWDETVSNFTLGDFNQLVNFLIANSGRGQMIEEIANGK